MAQRYDGQNDPEIDPEYDRDTGRYPVPIQGSSARPKPSKAAEAGRALGRGVKAAARGTGTAGRATYRVTRKATHAGGAGETGLSRLYEVHGLHNAGDAVVAIALAGTVFFAVPTGEARGQVALFLLLTLLPFSVLAPFIGPFLDRFSHGRRWAIGSTMAIRAFLCWVLASAVQSDSWTLFPAALGVLIASKAYNVTRSAATPRLLPPGLTLVKVNGRMSLAGMICAGAVAPLALLAATFGPEWPLRLAFGIFVIGTILAVLLPAAVDSTKGERQVSVQAMTGRKASTKVPPAVVTGFRANSGLRILSGFLTIYLAFLLREGGVPGWDGNPAILLGIVALAAGVGSGVGTLLGSLMRAVPPLALVKISLILDVAVAVIAAIQLHVFTVVLLAGVVGMCQQLGKLALDATIQDKVSEEVRTSVFGRSETLIQLSWVFGGMLGVIPINAALGMALVAGLMVGVLVVTFFGNRMMRARRDRLVAFGRRAPGDDADPYADGDADGDASPRTPRRIERSSPERSNTERARPESSRPTSSRPESGMLSDRDLLSGPIDSGDNPDPVNDRSGATRPVVSATRPMPASDQPSGQAGGDSPDDGQRREQDRGQEPGRSRRAPVADNEPWWAE